jgi:hypothetical protein
LGKPRTMSDDDLFAAMVGVADPLEEALREAGVE